MKVTKAKGLNCIWPSRFGYAPRGPLDTTRDDDNSSALDGSRAAHGSRVLNEPQANRSALEDL